MSRSTLVIDTPKNCGDCPFCIFTAEEKNYIGYCHTSDDDYYCKILDRFMDYDKVDGGFDILGKPTDCPLQAESEWQMTIEEQITIFEHNAEHERKEGDLNNCLHFHQLAEWLKELQAHREAWDGMKEGLLEMSRLHEYVSIKHMIQLIDEVRPKEGDA